MYRLSSAEAAPPRCIAFYCVSCRQKNTQKEYTRSNRKVRKCISHRCINGSGWVAQLVEQRTENPCVGGSIPPPATNFKNAYKIRVKLTFCRSSSVPFFASK